MALPARRMRVTALAASAVVVVMVGASFAAVPLYRIFCQVTGFGGTTQVASEAAPSPAESARTITVSLFGNVNAGLPWSFEPVQDRVTVKPGENALVEFRAVNRGAEPITGVATFNVTPFKAGRYFVKVECFCFSEQTLASGKTVTMPVSFHIDPKLAGDPNLSDVTDIALSYTFFRAPVGGESHGRGE